MQVLTHTIQAPADHTGTVYSASLSVYVWDNSVELYDGRLRPLVLVCPGGGYRLTSDREADTIASQFFAMGFHAAVLRYSVAPARYPTALAQLALSMRLIREHGAQWYVDTDNIAVLGCSAGGHLAACLACFWNEPELHTLTGAQPAQIRPNAQILCYPVITSGEYHHDGSFANLLGETDSPELRAKLSLERQVTADTPPAFIWNSYTDECVPAQNSLLYVQALCAHNISTEYHLFSIGAHGIGTATPVSMCKEGRGVQKECALWLPMAYNWLNHVWRV